MPEFEVSKSENEFVAELATDLERARNFAAGTGLVILRGDENIEDLAKFADKPRRIEQALIMENADSFKAYVEAYRGEHTAVFASLDKQQLAAIIDYHGTGGSAAHCSHRVTLEMRHTLPFQHWLKSNAKEMSQGRFAEFLEERYEEIVSEPRGPVTGEEGSLTPTGAELLGVAANFKATRIVNMESDERLDNGDVKFVYEADTKARSRKGPGEVVVPSEFAVKVPIYYGASPTSFRCRFRYRAPETANDKLVVWYAIHQVDLLQQRAFEAEVNRVVGDLKLPVFYGSPYA